MAPRHPKTSTTVVDASAGLCCSTGLHFCTCGGHVRKNMGVGGNKFACLMAHLAQSTQAQLYWQPEQSVRAVFAVGR